MPYDFIVTSAFSEWLHTITILDASLHFTRGSDLTFSHTNNNSAKNKQTIVHDFICLLSDKMCRI